VTTFKNLVKTHLFIHVECRCWEGLTQVCATLLGARHVPERLLSSLSALQQIDVYLVNKFEGDLATLHTAYESARDSLAAPSDFTA